MTAAAIGLVYAKPFRRRCMMGCLSVVASSWASVCLVPLAFANLLCMHILQQNGDVQFAAAAEVQAWMEAITINESIRTTTKPPANDRIIFNDTGSSPPQLDSPIGVFEFLAFSFEYFCLWSCLCLRNHGSNPLPGTHQLNDGHQSPQNQF